MVSEPATESENACSVLVSVGVYRRQTQYFALKGLGKLLQISAVAMQLTDLRFDNSSLRALPVEFVPEDTRLVEPQRQVKAACWSPIKPEPLKSPVLVAAALPCLGLLDLQAKQVCLGHRLCRTSPTLDLHFSRNVCELCPCSTGDSQ